MLMLWEDLEVGDVIRIKDELKYLYKDLYPSWVEAWCGINLEIYKIEIEDQIKIYFDSHYYVKINKDGTAYWDRYDGTPLEIVALKED